MNVKSPSKAPTCFKFLIRMLNLCSQKRNSYRDNYHFSLRPDSSEKKRKEKKHGFSFIFKVSIIVPCRVLVNKDRIYYLCFYEIEPFSSAAIKLELSTKDIIFLYLIEFECIRNSSHICRIITLVRNLLYQFSLTLKFILSGISKTLPNLLAHCLGFWNCCSLQ